MKMVHDIFKEMLKIKDDLCFGCSDYIKYGCALPPIYKEDLKCPCSICLIKPVCNQGCHDFKEFALKVPVCHKTALQNIYKTARKESK